MTTATHTGQAEAQRRMVNIVTENDDPVIYGGNPAELSGARYEMDECLRRAGAFQLLIKHRASKMTNSSVVATSDVSSIAFVLEAIMDTDVPNYTYEDPCPETNVRMARVNARRALAGQPPFGGIANINAIPDKFLKLAMPNPYEVATEDHAYALTQLSIFTDREHANRLLLQCNRSGLALRAILDAIEAEATGEDITLVTGVREDIVNDGLKGAELNEATFKKFWQDFTHAERRCPRNDRRSEQQKMQMISKLFYKDPVSLLTAPSTRGARSPIAIRSQA